MRGERNGWSIVGVPKGYAALDHHWTGYDHPAERLFDRCPSNYFRWFKLFVPKGLRPVNHYWTGFWTVAERLTP